MKEISEITAGFVDHGGLYQPLAEKLSETYKRVLYWDPKEEAFEHINDAVIGDSHPQNPRLERVKDLWLHKTECDLFIFPDSKGMGMQLELAGQGYPVWGGRRSQIIEQSREVFLKLLQEAGLDVPRHKRIIGIDALRDYLKDKTDQIIKISEYRGTFETYKWRSMDDDEAWLDMRAVELGGLKRIFPFLVFESIDTPFELGGDTYNIAGQFPKKMLDAYEAKDKSLFAAFKPVADMPEPMRAVMDVFGPILKLTGHRGFWSMEIRLLDPLFFFIDPTPRAPLPAIGSQMELYSNLPTIIAAGAEGELVEPEAEAQFAAECLLTMKNCDPAWGSVRVPVELERWMKLSGTVTVNGRKWFPTGESHGEEIGWLVATGDSPRETIETMLGYAELLPDGVEAHTESLIDLLKEIHKAEKEGIEFSPMRIPEPEIVIQND